MHTIRNWAYHMTWIILRVNVAIVLNTIKSIQNTVLGPLMHISIFACMLADSHTPSYIQTYLHSDISAYVHLYQYILSYTHAHGFLYTHIHIHNYTKTLTYKNTYSCSHIYEVKYTSTVPLHIPLHTHKHSYFITCLC